ncbi:hypothetical protein Sm713_41320 [Streptomyces sp. TS71-3]|nr:hypothetical protein Sm713_41320 [Streptomyces sp. TS71-3]
MWDSLHLFSPAEYSSLPGRLMPVQHGTRVNAVHRDEGHLLVETDAGIWRARAVISATGGWSRPFLPAVPG